MCSPHFLNPRRIDLLTVTLKQSLIISRNRDAEEKLMKDVEGWEVGTWYGHPIYKVSLSVLVSTVPVRALPRVARFMHPEGGSCLLVDLIFRFCFWLSCPRLVI
jgi:hypothetical protein